MRLSISSFEAGLSINGNTVAVRRLAKGQGGDGCHIVFISTSEAPRLKDTLALLSGNGLLTVSDIVIGEPPW